MARRLAALLLAALLLALAACGDASKDEPPAASVAGAAGGAVAGEPVPTELPVAQGVNPFTGRALDEGAIQGQRPVALLVGNNTASLPQKGVASADLVVESLTEGGITRLMACYGDYRAVPEVGPVRSLRDEHVQAMLPSNAILVHIGSSIYAKNLLAVLGYSGVDGFTLGEGAFYFDEARAAEGRGNEYNWYTNAELVWQGMQTTQLSLMGEVRCFFHFEGEDKGVRGADAWAVTADFSEASQSGFVFNEERGLYDKTMNGQLHQDDGGKQCRYRNVFLLSVPATTKEDGVVTDYDLAGGTGMYFNRGQSYPINWVKGGPSDPFHFYHADGSEVQVQVGRSYIGLLPASRENAIRWEGQAAEAE